jgi:hypothetical protein
VGESFSSNYQREQDFLAETIGEYGPWKALRLFTDPTLTGLERMHIHDATRRSIWRTVEYGNPQMIDDHLLVIDYMEKAVAAEILADLVRAKQTGIEPLPTEPIPIHSTAQGHADNQDEQRQELLA